MSWNSGTCVGQGYFHQDKNTPYKTQKNRGHSGFALQWEGPFFYMCMPSPNFFNQSSKLYKNIVKKYLGTPQGLGYPNQGPQGPLGYTWGPKNFFQNFSYRTKIGSYFTHFLHLFCEKIQKSRKPYFQGTQGPKKYYLPWK